MWSCLSHVTRVLTLEWMGRRGGRNNLLTKGRNENVREGVRYQHSCSTKEQEKEGSTEGKSLSKSLKRGRKEGRKEVVDSKRVKDL